jgi:hypothetical protein
LRGQRIDIRRQASLAPQIVPDILVARDRAVRIEPQTLGERPGEGRRGGGVEPLGILVAGQQGAVAPDRLAVLAPVARQRPARQLLARIPLALAVVQQRAGRETVGKAAQQDARATPLGRAQGRGVPFRAVGIVGRDEGRFAAHRQPDSAAREPRIDRGAGGIQRGPLRLRIGHGHPRGLTHARDRHLELEARLGLLVRSRDRRRAAGLGRRRKRDVPLPREQAGCRVQPDPARTRQIDFAPGMQIGEVARRSRGSVERLLVGGELDEIARDETRREAEMAQHLDKQPAAVAARAVAEREGLLGRLHAGLHADQITDMRRDAPVEADQEIDRAGARAIDRRQEFRQQGARRHGAQERRDLLGQRRIVGEGRRLGLRLEEEIEGIDHRHVGDQIDDHLETVGGFRHHDPGEEVSLRILLPVQEMRLGRDRQRVGQDRRAGMRRRPQPDGLRPQRDRPLIVIGRAMA